MNLYSKDDLAAMQLSEHARLPGQNRIREIIAYAGKGGIRCLGIANCIVFKRETESLKKLIEKESDIEVHAIDCKCGKLDKGDILGTGFNGIMCNPAGQAQYLAQRGTQLNVAVGLCMGHDLVFASKSQAPVTTLIVKDRQKPCDIKNLDNHD